MFESNRPLPSLRAARGAGLIDEGVDDLFGDLDFAARPTAILKGIGPLTEIRLGHMDIHTVLELTHAPVEDVHLAGKIATDLQRTLRASVRRPVAA